MRITFLYLLLFFSFRLQAQFSLPESGFENWTSFTSGTGAVTYEDPSGGWWGTLNKLSFILQGNPVTTYKTTDAHSGSYAALLETKISGTTLLLPGLLFAGYFDENSPSTNFIIQGRPFTDQPTKVKGYYKHTSVSGDSCGIYVLLTKFNTGTLKRDTVATAVFSDNQTISSYTYFERTLQYKTAGISPDTMFLTIISSLGWSNFTNAQVGSKFWLDDLSLEYVSGTENLMEEKYGPVVYPNPCLKELFVEAIPGQRFQLLNGCSQSVFSCEIKEHVSRITLPVIPPGFYFYSITGEGKRPVTGKISVAKP